MVISGFSGVAGSVGVDGSSGVGVAGSTGVTGSSGLSGSGSFFGGVTGLERSSSLFELLQCWPEAYLLTRKQEEHRQAFELDQLNPA